MVQQRRGQEFDLTGPINTPDSKSSLEKAGVASERCAVKPGERPNPGSGKLLHELVEKKNLWSLKKKSWGSRKFWVERCVDLSMLGKEKKKKVFRLLENVAHRLR